VTKSKRHIARIKELPCVACLQMGYTTYGVDAHHILSGGRRIDDYHCLPLCRDHHRGGMNDSLCVSRHPWRREFEARYGTEERLLEIVKELMDETQTA
jgi:hypothetical protein